MVLVEEVFYQVRELGINVSEHETEIVGFLPLGNDPLEIVHDAVGMVWAWLGADGVYGGTCLEDAKVELHDDVGHEVERR